MALRGTRFNIDLNENDDEPQIEEEISENPHEASSFSLVKDVLERASSAPKAPTAPTLKSSNTGFPAHKNRTGISKFKAQRRAEEKAKNGHADSTGNSSVSADFNDREALERQQIDQENKQRLAAMSDEEIAREQQELMATLSPAFLEKLLKRSTIDDTVKETNTPRIPKTSQSPSEISTEQSQHQQIDSESLQESSSSPTKRVTFNDSTPLISEPSPIQTSSQDQPQQQSSSLSTFNIDDAAPTSFPNDPHPTQFHFPKPAPLPSLDPSDPNFLDQLHEKYFPDLPADPSSLAWMRENPPITNTSNNTDTDTDDTYSPTAPTHPVSSLRFTFSGALLPPLASHSLPTHLGLHHHGSAPSAAGYTVPELAHLARSAFPAQRCVAYQLLGRVLYRLGKGQFGDEDSDLASGLWDCVRDGRVIESLEAEATKEGKGTHLSAKAYATEALWLWRRGGGRRWAAT